MQYPTEYMTALIAVSAAFMAVAGIIVGFVATRNGRQRDIWLDRMIILAGLGSVVLGFVTMSYALLWFAYPEDSFRSTAQYCLLSQFAFVYVPLWWFGLRVVFRRR
jgi:MFS family permease